MIVEFEGMTELMLRLEGITNPEKVNAALTNACLLVERTAKQRAPKGNGDLRNSIQSRVENGVGIVFTNKEYAPYVEYGTGLFAEEGGRTDVPWCYKDLETGEFIYTSGQHPKPYMRPALDENKERIKQMLGEGITKK